MIIYYFNDFEAFGDEQIEQMLSWMPQQQRDTISGTKLLSRKREIAVSYLMLCYAIENNKKEINSSDNVIKEFSSSNCQLSIVNCQFTIAEHGKPYLTNHESIFFNISHCKEAVAVGISSHEIGVDIEGRRRFSDTLLDRAFNEREKVSVRQNDNPEMEFARIWTRKEAFFKWTGTGILIDHIKSVEQDAAAAGCDISTQLVTPDRGNPFFLSIAN